MKAPPQPLTSRTALATAANEPRSCIFKKRCCGQAEVTSRPDEDEPKVQLPLVRLNRPSDQDKDGSVMLERPSIDNDAELTANGPSSCCSFGNPNALGGSSVGCGVGGPSSVSSSSGNNNNSRVSRNDPAARQERRRQRRRQRQNSSLRKKRSSAVNAAAAAHAAAAASDKRRRAEDRQAVVFMGFIAVFLVCHCARLLLDAHELLTLSEINACRAHGRPGVRLWARCAVHASHLLLALNSATNILVYCGLSSRFREEFCRRFAWACFLWN